MPTRPSSPPARSLRRIERPRLYEQLARTLCEYISDTGLQPGDRLPPERELASRLGVSRVSISQALVALEVQGIVDVRHGEGAVLVDSHAGLVSAVQARRRRLAEVLEAREALEVKLAELAARRRTEADLLLIDEALAQMERELREGGLGEGGDERFHAAVTATARSNLLADLMGEIAIAVRESRIESLSQPGRPEHSLRSHRRIADAIRAGDPVRAAEAMREHIRLVSDVALLRDQ
ncbi:FadR/GntR family transcriptional regulator [Actinomadura alba]|uniref:FadR family transcriptional regulator n=1 Tax=Actinomadura alba TaxID=406431 RepID=A0ABR7LT58_9ACTN|nr:FCD domain-containing protein [Actinomadura alba]MBC6467682.1 FadR family transcriptional regulator [Actinomadura alba]